MELLIKAIRVKDLFGFYSYDLPSAGKSLPDAAIFYGDNGLGKSTVLRLVFHMLSPADNKGHRSALLEVPYRYLEVELSSGIVLRASRRAEIDEKALVLDISKGSKTLAEWNFSSPGHHTSDVDRILNELTHVSSESSNKHGISIKKTSDGRYIFVDEHHAARGRKNHPRGETAYMRELLRHVPNMFLLNAERRLDSDIVSDPSDEVELRRALRIDEPKRINDLVVRSREIALSQALSAAGKWISAQAVQGANRGSTNVHGVYVNVLRHLVAPAKKNQAGTDLAHPETLLTSLTEIESKSAQLAKYELTAELSTSDFRRALQATAKTKRQIAANLLKPYLDSLQGRLAALEPVYRVVDDFVTIVNGFLYDKSLSFGFSSGFQIKNKRGDELGPRLLSSGEQQLLLLFCYALVSRDKPSVFIIDEPEISLNVKWQRKLVQSLLDITKGSRIQFILASHSMELIAQHRGRVVKLESRDG